MKLGKILNAELNKAIASMGHGDLMIVCDAGYPIPNEVWRIDLAIAPDLPDLETVLRLINEDFYAEKVGYAAELETYNPPVLAMVKDIFQDREHFTLPADEVIFNIPKQAKCIVRTGAFNPWGNILLYSGIDAPQWFNKPGTVAPPHYQRRLK
jgi:simple sugar transport system permease protein/D-ribose pyranase